MKKGATHIGFVLSFVIFIMFVIFMFSFIEPFLKTQASKQSLLDFFRFSLVEEFEVGDLTITTIYYKGDSSNPIRPCIKDNIAGKKLASIITDANKEHLKIKDENGNTVDYDFQGGGTLFQIDLDPLNVKDSTNDGIFKVYYSNEILSTTSILTGCKEIDTNNVIEIGSLVEEQSQILKSNIDSLKVRYEMDCGETIKTDLGIPEGNDFTFSFELTDGSIIEPDIEACGGIPNTNVYATTFPLEYLDSDANLQIGFLTIKVW